MDEKKVESNGAHKLPDEGRRRHVRARGLKTGARWSMRPARVRRAARICRGGRRVRTPSIRPTNHNYV